MAHRTQLRENHAIEQALDKMGTYIAALRTGQVEPSQTVDTLMAMGGKRSLDKHAQTVAEACNLPRKIQHPATALKVSLLVQARDQLGSQALQQGFECLAHLLNISAGRACNQALTQHIFGAVALQRIKELGKPSQPISWVNTR